MKKILLSALMIGAIAVACKKSDDAPALTTTTPTIGGKAVTLTVGVNVIGKDTLNYFAKSGDTLDFSISLKSKSQNLKVAKYDISDTSLSNFSFSYTFKTNDYWSANLQSSDSNYVNITAINGSTPSGQYYSTLYKYKDSTNIFDTLSKIVIKGSL